MSREADLSSPNPPVPSATVISSFFNDQKVLDSLVAQVLAGKDAREAASEDNDGDVLFQGLALDRLDPRVFKQVAEFIVVLDPGKLIVALFVQALLVGRAEGEVRQSIPSSVARLTRPKPTLSLSDMYFCFRAFGSKSNLNRSSPCKWANRRDIMS